MAVFGFKGLGWFACGVIVAPACYMVTSVGASERARLAQVELRIVAARKEIRVLETEYRTRANMSQLQQWNGEALQLAAPGPQQFASDGTAVAALEAVEQETPRAQLAAVVPSGAPIATMMAAAKVQTGEPKVQPAVATREKAGAKPAVVPVVAKADGLVRARGTAVAMVEDRLLSASTIADLERLARSEKLANR